MESDTMLSDITEITAVPSSVLEPISMLGSGPSYLTDPVTTSSLLNTAQDDLSTAINQPLKNPTNIPTSTAATGSLKRPADNTNASILISNEYCGYEPLAGISYLTGRVDANIAPSQFFEQYISTRRPAVINCLADLESAGLPWTQDYLVSKAGSTRVTVEDHTVVGVNRPTIEMRYKDFIAALFAGETRYHLQCRDEQSSNSIVRDRNAVLSTVVEPLPELSSDFPLHPTVCGNLILHQVALCQGRVGSAVGDSTELQHYFHDTLHLLLKGRRRFRLFPPSTITVLRQSGCPYKVHTNGLIVYLPAERSKQRAFDVRADGAPLVAVARQKRDDAEYQLIEAEDKLFQLQKVDVVSQPELQNELEKATKTVRECERLVDVTSDELDKFYSDYEEEDVISIHDDDSEPEATDEPPNKLQKLSQELEQEDVEQEDPQDSDVTTAAVTDEPYNGRYHRFQLPADDTVDVDVLFRDCPQLKSVGCLVVQLNVGEMLYLPASWFFQMTSYDEEDEFYEPLSQATSTPGAGSQTVTGAPGPELQTVLGAPGAVSQTVTGAPGPELQTVPGAPGAVSQTVTGAPGPELQTVPGAPGAVSQTVTGASGAESQTVTGAPGVIVTGTPGAVAQTVTGAPGPELQTVPGAPGAVSQTVTGASGAESQTVTGAPGVTVTGAVAQTVTGADVTTSSVVEAAATVSPVGNEEETVEAGKQTTLVSDGRSAVTQSNVTDVVTCLPATGESNAGELLAGVPVGETLNAERCEQQIADSQTLVSSSGEKVSGTDNKNTLPETESEAEKQTISDSEAGKQTSSDTEAVKQTVSDSEAVKQAISDSEAVKQASSIEIVDLSSTPATQTVSVITVSQQSTATASVPARSLTGYLALTYMWQVPDGLNYEQPYTHSFWCRRWQRHETELRRLLHKASRPDTDVISVDSESSGEDGESDYNSYDSDYSEELDSEQPVFLAATQPTAAPSRQAVNVGIGPQTHSAVVVTARSAAVVVVGDDSSNDDDSESYSDDADDIEPQSSSQQTKLPSTQLNDDNAQDDIIIMDDDDDVVTQQQQHPSDDSSQLPNGTNGSADNSRAELRAKLASCEPVDMELCGVDTDVEPCGESVIKTIDMDLCDVPSREQLNTDVANVELCSEPNDLRLKDCQ